MARETVALVCSECKQRNYTTTIKKGRQQKLELRKYCRWCRGHTLHRQR